MGSSEDATGLEKCRISTRSPSGRQSQLSQVRRIVHAESVPSRPLRVARDGPTAPLDTTDPTRGLARTEGTPGEWAPRYDLAREDHSNE